MSTRASAIRRASGRTKHVGISKLWTVVVLVIMVAAACYFLLPVIWIIVASTKDTNSLLSTGLFSLPKHNQFFHNLVTLSTFEHGQYWLWYLNSLIYAGVIGVFTCIVCSMAGFALAKFRFRGKQGVFAAVMASLMIPGTVIAIPLFILDGFLGIRDSYLGVILPMIVNPFGVYFLRIYVNDVVPDELLEAGKVDGASMWRLFWQVVFPIIRPALATLFLISFIGTWNNFFLPLVILHSSSLFPVTLGLDTWISSMNTPAALQVGWYPLIITGSLVSIIPMVIGFIFLKKYIVVGLAQGSVKM
ncbi:carbohydrate ABC transporter permease [Alicyclobacillus fastidiosus]|uniref:Carbohydrate ABC transporter permease n=1 Tax=Alicyclobacillus fastidiosus TaxID=392011 RepID=A0ABV5AB00_9BACL|nr:carbohydrate ABC transporter permease [Alicyclobacillus fastidiosus]WEH10730.1 carbohydrate ABC transporter permease [Alicyclobacillus fastidiosus]